MKRPTIIRNRISIYKTCLLFFHNKHVFEGKLHTSLNTRCILPVIVYLQCEDSSWLKSDHCIMQQVCILLKSSLFRIAIQGRGFLLSNVQTFYIQNFSCISFRFNGNGFFWQDTDIRFPDYMFFIGIILNNLKIVHNICCHSVVIIA